MMMSCIRGPFMFFLLLGALTAMWLARVIQDQQAAFRDADFSQLASNLTVIVTGSNSGLGYATVEHLARMGTAHTVVMACRNQAKCQDAQKRASRLIPQGSSTRLVAMSLDLASRSSIESFAQEFHDNNATIDVLINNAGIFTSSSGLTYIDGVEEHMQVNYLGHVVLTHLLWPLLEKSHARVVSVSSISALIPSDPTVGWFSKDPPLWSARFAVLGGLFRYFRSKRANLMFAQHLDQQRSSHVSSVASHPGYTRSEIWSQGAQIFPSWMGRFIQWNPLCSMSSSDGGLTQLWAALDRRGVPSGTYVGPQWWLFGTPILLGRIGDFGFPPHYWPLSKESELWEQTLQTLGIRQFSMP